VRLGLRVAPHFLIETCLAVHLLARSQPRCPCMVYQRKHAWVRLDLRVVITTNVVKRATIRDLDAVSSSL